MVFLTALGMLHGKSKKEPNFVFVHGLMQNSKDAGYYESKTFNILPGKTVLIDFPCTENMPQRISNPVKLSLGQAYEIKSLAKACRRIQAPTVLVGLSMGAATILNYTATHRNRHIKALVVEAPFDHIGTVVRNITMGLLSKEKSAHLAKLIAWFHYKPTDIQPENVVHLIKNEMPILFVHSKKDRFIPISASRNLYSILRKSGHNNVYLLELNSGLHALYQNRFNTAEARRYLVTVHAFYKKYNLPHDEALAAEGEPILEQCQPDPDLLV